MRESAARALTQSELARQSFDPRESQARWDAIDADKYRDEQSVLHALLKSVPFSPAERSAVRGQAVALVAKARRATQRQGMMEGFLQEFSLSTSEGLALMGLAEALLRTPDAGTKNRLIFEKIGAADWAAHLGQSEKLFVNASTWALMLTAKLADPHAMADPIRTLKRLSLRVGEPVVRAAVAQAIRIMGEQFVLGRNMDSALARAKKENLICSFDMLGEGARTAAEAARYEAAYEASIRALQAFKDPSAPLEAGHGVSVKLSALSPRYEATQEARVWDELYPRLLRLAVLAADANINFTLDAEESDRLVLSLKLLNRLAREPRLGNWQGLGLAVQAYQKRAPKVIAELAVLARESGRRLMVRLVKGAYWDSEIKRAQVTGMPDYPVFTTKAATDVSYLVCAEALIKASPFLYGQFATHNAHTLAAVKAMADRASVAIEFQRLHGMGDALYAAAQDMFGPLPVRTYAPVGAHQDLLPYLVRRLLENGANTSFVHLLLEDGTDPDLVVKDPVEQLQAAGADRHPRIPIPPLLYGDRRNSIGLNFSENASQKSALAALEALRARPVTAAPIIAGHSQVDNPITQVMGPYGPNDVFGHTAETSPAQIDAAFAAAHQAQAAWDAKGGIGRAITLRAMGDALQNEMLALAALCVAEAGKTWPDAIAEVREAIDFCRYYAALAEREFGGPTTLKGPVGETNVLDLHGRGVFACVSPWNFPLAIFTGQVAAALAAGNAVLAKPAEQTPLIAAMAVRLFHRAGLEANLLHLVPGRGEVVGPLLTAHPGLDGIAFTGGTQTAKAINRALAARDGAIVPFIAETGGLNAMFVDTTAQREQVIDDVILSAFGSAGQRCSALRLLFLPEETADGLIEGLAGAMDALVVGDPGAFATDIGPIIDAEAKDALQRHATTLYARGKILKRCRVQGESAQLFAPALAELTLNELPDREVFGPILHVIRYKPDGLEAAAKALAAKGYGLTLGIHSRLDSFAQRVRALVPAGNSYINRSIIGAVVGVQPFGGEGLSGTGPKAGGPFALYRYAVERAVSTNITAQGGDPALLNL
jgi:RHH-type proline utilization regulon transcriptional repressor/proline dehydrogenase/delta 1-pyrroline-5-carboxylate dehydrogenase